VELHHRFHDSPEKFALVASHRFFLGKIDPTINSPHPGRKIKKLQGFKDAKLEASLNHGNPTWGAFI